MRVFVSYGHTGQDTRLIRPLLEAVGDVLRERDIHIHNTFFDVRGGDLAKPELGQAGFMREAFTMLDRSDVLVVLQTGTAKSEGMLMEVGYAIAKKMPVVVATQADVINTYLPEMATKLLRWHHNSDLVEQLRELDFESLQA